MLVAAFIVVSFTVGAWGLLVLVSAQSSIHEIGAIILFLIMAVGLAAAGIIYSTNRIADRLPKPEPQRSVKKQERIILLVGVIAVLIALIWQASR